MFVANAGLTLWLLASQTVGTFLWARTVVSVGLTGGAIVVSTVWFKRVLCRQTSPAALTA